MRSDMIALDPDRLSALLQHKGYKQYHIAKMLGVSPKTVNRWCTGKVSYVSLTNGKQLADLLDCDIEDFGPLKSNENDALYQQLFTDDLLLTLSPSGSWAMLESILASMPQDQISNQVKGKLLNWLSITSWRQRKYDQGMAYALEAKDLGRDTDLEDVYYQALANIATIQGIQGYPQPALAAYLECYEHLPKMGTAKDQAALCNNLAMTYFDLGLFDQAATMQEKTIQLYSTGPYPYNLAIGYAVLGLCQIELGLWPSADQALAQALTQAQTSNFVEGKVTVPLYQLYSQLKQGQVPASQAYDPLIKSFLEKATYDPYCYHIIDLYFRMVGHLDRAEETILTGLDKVKEAGLLGGILLKEYALLQTDKGELAQANLLRAKSNACFKEAGIINRSW